MNKQIKIEDNYLEIDKFNELQNFMLGSNFPWFYNPCVSFIDEITDKFQFTHLFYSHYEPQSTLYKILDSLLIKIAPISIFRIKANLLTRTTESDPNKFHCDIDDGKEWKAWTTSIFYLNSNNGYTEFKDGTKVESIENRLVTFPCNLEHRGASSSNVKARVIMNFNYIKNEN